MVYIIIKETKREREEVRAEKLARNPSLQNKVQDFARTADEAHDAAYHQHGEQELPIVVEGGQERSQAFMDDVGRLGQQIGKILDVEKIADQWGFDLKTGAKKRD